MSNNNDKITLCLSKVFDLTGEDLSDEWGYINDLRRRSANGQLFAEFGTPELRTYRSAHVGWRDRFRTIDENRVCGKIQVLEICGNSGDVTIEITPYGPFAESMKIMRANDQIDTKFSIRALVDAQKRPKEIIAFDFIPSF